MTIKFVLWDILLSSFSTYFQLGISLIICGYRSSTVIGQKAGQLQIRKLFSLFYKWLFLDCLCYFAFLFKTVLLSTLQSKFDALLTKCTSHFLSIVSQATLKLFLMQNCKASNFTLENYLQFLNYNLRYYF